MLSASTLGHIRGGLQPAPHGSHQRSRSTAGTRRSVPDHGRSGRSGTARRSDAERASRSTQLASRSGQVVRDGQGLDAQLSAIRSSAAEAVTPMCDAAEPADAVSAFQLLVEHRLGGVLHAAGVPRDTLMRNMRASQGRPCSHQRRSGRSTARVDAATQPAARAVFVSTSALGNVGGSPRGCQPHPDAMSQSRRTHATEGHTIQLPLVAGAGMGAAAILAGHHGRQKALRCCSTTTRRSCVRS